MADPKSLYRTRTALERTLRVSYPAGAGRLTLRTDEDWDTDIDAETISSDSRTWTFRVRAARPFVYFKACLIQDAGERHWAVGHDNLLLMAEDDKRVYYPFFLSPPHGQFSPLIEFPSAVLAGC